MKQLYTGRPYLLVYTATSMGRFPLALPSGLRPAVCAHPFSPPQGTPPEFRIHLRGGMWERKARYAFTNRSIAVSDLLVGLLNGFVKSVSRPGMPIRDRNVDV